MNLFTTSHKTKLPGFYFISVRQVFVSICIWKTEQAMFGLACHCTFRVYFCYEEIEQPNIDIVPNSVSVYFSLNNSLYVYLWRSCLEEIMLFWIRYIYYFKKRGMFFPKKNVLIPNLKNSCQAINKRNYSEILPISYNFKFWRRKNLIDSVEILNKSVLTEKKNPLKS